MTRVIGVTAAAGTAPSFRVRLMLPGAELRRHGVELEPHPLFPHGKGARRRGLGEVLGARRTLARAVAASDATVALIQRQADVLPLPSLERRAMRGRRLVYDVDDAIWFDGPTAGGHPLAILKGSRFKARWLAERADQVIAGNEILADWLARYAQAVEVVPSLVDTDAAPQHEPSDREELVVGWIGSRTTAPYLGGLRAPLERVASAVRRPVCLLTIGGLAPPVRGVRSVQRPWSTAAEAAALREMDVGVMPLPDNRWTRGKCAYKAIQYMASGVPVLADDVGVTRSVVGPGGLVVDHPRDWEDALVTLLQSEPTRRELGAAGRVRAEEQFSITAWGARIAQLLRGS